MQEVDIQTIKDEVEKEIKPIELKIPEVHNGPNMLCHKLYEDHSVSSITDVKRFKARLRMPKLSRFLRGFYENIIRMLLA